MGQLRNSSRSFAGGSCDSAALKSYFDSFECADDQEGGILQFMSEDRTKCSLAVVPWAKLGLVVTYKSLNMTTNRYNSSLVFVGDRTRLAEMVEQDDIFYPAGCILQPAVAWMVVEDFLNEPTTPSSRVDSIDSSEIQVPPR